MHKNVHYLIRAALILATWLLTSVAGHCFLNSEGPGDKRMMGNVAHRKGALQCKYGPLGEVIRATGPTANINPLRFSTKYQDDETDLLYYGYRYYNASTGRWLARDPVAEQGGINVYAAMANNPVSAIDLHGTCCECALSLNIKTIRKLPDPPNPYSIRYGHEWQLEVEMAYLNCKEDGHAQLIWKEKWNVPTDIYGPDFKPNTWMDLYAKFGGSLLMTAFTQWDQRDASCISHMSAIRTVPLTDEPMWSTRLGQRTIQWDIEVKNPKCCGDKLPDPKAIFATQALNANRDFQITQQELYQQK